MIKVRYLIHFSDDRKVTKNFQFGNFHEKKFQIFYDVIKSRVEQKIDTDFEQFLIFCAFNFAIGIRKKHTTETIQYSLNELIHKNKIIRQDVKSISLEAVIDNLPKKIISISI